MSNLRAPARHLRRHVVVSTLLLASLCGPALAGSSATVPAGFKAYATTDIGGHRQCVVGSATDDDGMNARAFVYVEDTATHKPQWVTPLPLGNPDWYQNRATHCLGDAGKVYALVQDDTQSQASLSQTFVTVATLDAASGKVQATQRVKVPEVKGGVSAWVNEGSDHFRLEGGKVVVTGEYFQTSDRDVHKPFTASPSTPVSK